MAAFGQAKRGDDGVGVQYVTFQKEKKGLNHEDSVNSLACLSRLLKHVTLVTLLCTNKHTQVSKLTELSKHISWSI
jgi:hypothetical protein